MTVEKQTRLDLPVRADVHINVGVCDAEMNGNDNRASQAAVDYVSNLGGGVVNLRPAEHLMRDSPHLRNCVTVRGAG